MGFFSSFFKGKKGNHATPFETFLRAFSDDPHLADKMIRDTKHTNRLMMAICLACLSGGYTITAEIRDSLADLPSLPGTSPAGSFPFDAVAQEVIALLFYIVMAEHMREDDETEEEDEDEPESEQFKALKEARYLADSLATKYIPSRSPEYFRGRLLTYSLVSYKRKSIFEEAANHILKAVNSGSDRASIDDVMKFAVIQQALASNMLSAIKDGVNRLYADWQSNPEGFGS